VEEWEKVAEVGTSLLSKTAASDVVILTVLSSSAHKKILFKRWEDIRFALMSQCNYLLWGLLVPTALP
jgi:hypothetical protein